MGGEGEGGGGGHSGGDAEHEGCISTAKPDPDLGFPSCPQEEEGRGGRAPPPKSSSAPRTFLNENP
jgi:hypothetical protein